jgi:hypothetical protein
MAFDYTKFQKSTQGDALDVNTIWMYTKTDETLAAIGAAGYFNNVNGLVGGTASNEYLQVNDIIWIVGSDGASFYSVTAVTPNVTTAAFSVVLGAGSVGTINIADGAVTAAKIANLTIENADVAAAAAIDFSKLAALPSAQILVGSAGNVPTAVAVTGDVGISNTGVTAITAGAIVNADINAAAAIAFDKLAALASANILVGSTGNVATAVAMSGDVAISNTGATTIQAGAIDLAMLSAGITPSHVVKFAGQPTTVGGAAAEAFAVAGVLNTDLAFVQIVDNGGANVTALQAVCTADTLTVTFSANPGNDTVFNYQILRAAT